MRISIDGALLCCQSLLNHNEGSLLAWDHTVLSSLAPGHGSALYKEDCEAKHQIDDIPDLNGRCTSTVIMLSGCHDNHVLVNGSCAALTVLVTP